MNDIDAQENPLTNYWNFGVYKKQKFVTLTSHIFGFCLFVVNHNYFEKLSNLNKKFLIKKSKKTTEFQRQLAINEDDILIKKINSENIKIETIDEKNLIEFKSITNVFQESYFQTYPHMQKYIKLLIILILKILKNQSRLLCLLEEHFLEIFYHIPLLLTSLCQFFYSSFFYLFLHQIT